MAYDYKNDESVLEFRKIPCMTEGCTKPAFVEVPKGEPVPRGLRKWCQDCRKSKNMGLQRGRHNTGFRRA